MPFVLGTGTMKGRSRLRLRALAPTPDRSPRPDRQKGALESGLRKSAGEFYSFRCSENLFCLKKKIGDPGRGPPPGISDFPWNRISQEWFFLFPVGGGLPGPHPPRRPRLWNVSGALGRERQRQKGAGLGWGCRLGGGRAYCLPGHQSTAPGSLERADKGGNRRHKGARNETERRRNRGEIKVRNQPSAPNHNSFWKSGQQQRFLSTYHSYREGQEPQEPGAFQHPSCRPSVQRSPSGVSEGPLANDLRSAHGAQQQLSKSCAQSSTGAQQGGRFSRKGFSV
eukprot:XP_017454514.1 PREDICTED: uncharacterized protein LOC103692077 isoform X1 [Rattus norvegicus]